MIIQTGTITETPDELLAQLERKELYLPTLTHMSAQRQQEWLTTRVMLKKLLGEEKKICYTASGKPYLSDHSCHISISHTRNYVSIALDAEHPVAVDMEYISTRIQRIRSRFMNEKEEAHLSTAFPDIHALLHWSAKEVLFKLMDENDICFRTQLHIHPFKPILSQWSTFTAHETRTKRKQHFIIRFFITKEYVLVVS